jgi:hypothetical protein
MCTKFYSENLKRRDHLRDLGTGGSTILKFILSKCGVGWIGFIWHRISSSGGLL